MAANSDRYPTFTHVLTFLSTVAAWLAIPELRAFVFGRYRIVLLVGAFLGLAGMWLAVPGFRAFVKKHAFSVLVLSVGVSLVAWLALKEPADPAGLVRDTAAPSAAQGDPEKAAFSFELECQENSADPLMVACRGFVTNTAMQAQDFSLDCGGTFAEDPGSRAWPAAECYIEDQPHSKTVLTARQVEPNERKFLTITFRFDRRNTRLRALQLAYFPAPGMNRTFRQEKIAVTPKS